jgi:glycosyltransferase involved in cell wall biosynthesis
MDPPRGGYFCPLQVILMAGDRLREAPGTDEAPLRIAHFALGRTNPEAADGIDKTVYHLTRAQAQLGHTVRLFSVTNKTPIPIPGVEVSPYPSIIPSPLLFTPRLRDLLAWRSPLNLPSRLVSDLIAWHPDMLHLHGVHVPQHLRLARQARGHGIPYCVTVHNMLAGRAIQRRRRVKRVVALLERPYLDRAAFLHALTDQERDDLRAYGTCARVVIAPNGIEPDGMSVEASLEAAADLPVRPVSGLEFMFLGRLAPEEKGLDLLLHGFARSGVNEAVLTLVGPDWREGRRTLEALVHQLELTSRVVLAGPAFAERKLRLLTRADIFVLTSRWEGVSFAVLEAACLAKPCLLTLAADPRGAFGAAGAAIVVTPDPEAIAKGMQTLAGMTAQERQKMGHRARRLIETEFGWPPTARRLIEAYRAHSQPADPL